MGGDLGPAAVVEGAAWLSLEREDIHSVLVGPQDVVGPLLDSLHYDPARLALHHATDWVRPETRPDQQLGEETAKSIEEACGLVARGEADAVVTAGSTGGAILAAAESLGRISGVRRAALAAVIPTERSHGPRDDPFALLLDVGATVQATAEDLIAFAVMGSAYAAVVSGNEAPKVALLSNGQEAHKGPPAVVEAHRQLRELDFLSFVGNVEGLDIPRGTVDVIVTDGYLGNVLVKVLEGIGEVVADLARDAYARKFLWRLGLTLLSSGVREVEALIDWESYGGAPILGFRQPIIKAHGRSGPRAIANACRVAHKVCLSPMVGEIEAAMARLSLAGQASESGGKGRG